MVSLHVARAQEFDDTDAARVHGEVVGAMIVDAEGQSIDLGVLAAGAALSVPADGAGEGEVATFELTAPPPANIDVTLKYADLESEDTGDVIGLGAPDSSVLCYRNDEDAGDGDDCDVEFEEKSGQIPHNETGGGPQGGEGTAFVGYAVNVDEDVDAGEYSHPEAIVLEAEALLQGGGNPGGGTPGGGN